MAIRVFPDNTADPAAFIAAAEVVTGPGTWRCIGRVPEPKSWNPLPQAVRVGGSTKRSAIAATCLWTSTRRQ